MDKVLVATGFEKEVDRRKNGLCPFCGKEVNVDLFKNELSKKEFKMSGLCQSCQDSTFGKDEEDLSCP